VAHEAHEDDPTRAVHHASASIVVPYKTTEAHDSGEAAFGHSSSQQRKVVLRLGVFDPHQLDIPTRSRLCGPLARIALSTLDHSTVSLAGCLSNRRVAPINGLFRDARGPIDSLMPDALAEVWYEMRAVLTTECDLLFMTTTWNFSVGCERCSTVPHPLSWNFTYTSRVRL
jgi:hypothetical protein